MKRFVKSLIKTGSFLLVTLALVAVWTVYFHNPWALAKVPQWKWLQAAVKHMGQTVPVLVEEDEDPDTMLNQIPVHVGKVTKETLHRYIEGYGQVVPQPPRKGQMSGSANIVSAVAGVASKVNCELGQKVKAGDVLVELDARLAKSAEEQAVAALAQEEAGLAALKATPRPEQVAVAQLAIDKATASVEFAQKNYDRQVKLVAEQGTASKNVEQAAADLATAKNDLAVAQKQMALLKASPTPEEMRQEEAKVRQAQAALATAKLQSQLLTIQAPIDGTVTAINVNPGEAVDTAKTLISLLALDRLMVDVDVPAEQLPVNVEGLSVVMTRQTNTKAGADSGAIEAKVTYVSPQVETKNGAVMLGIDLPAGTTLRPGLTVRVRIIAEEHKDILAVPREAVVEDENHDSTVAIISDETETKTATGVHKTATAKKRIVKPGLEENGLLEITTDLKEGATVATQGAYSLRTADGSLQQTRVKVVE